MLGALLAEHLTAADRDLLRGPALTADDLVLISRNMDAKAPWLDSGTVVSTMRLFTASMRFGHSPAVVADRVAGLGYRLDTNRDRLPNQPLTASDVFLLSGNLDGNAPWLYPGARVTADHLFTAATRLGRSPAAMPDRLSELGYRVSIDRARLPIQPLTDDDVTILSRKLDAKAPWLDLAAEVSSGHLLTAAMRLRRSPAAVADWLAALGYRLGTDRDLLPNQPLTRNDVTMLSRNLDGKEPWLDSATAVSASRLFIASAACGCSPTVVLTDSPGSVTG
jgi:hypothetical protein